MVFEDGGLKYYNYGEDGAPAGVGKSEQSWPSIIAEAKETDLPFEDPHFPADETVIKGCPEIEKRDLFIEWFRPTEIAEQMFNANPLFHGEYTEFAINQGLVGDCWFLSVLADVALQPDCINTMVPPDNNTVGFDTGAFHFRFWCRGKWLDVVVDDRLPCLMDKSGGILAPCFSKPTREGGFWACLLEKAYAKMYGSYANINLGDRANSMMDFTGGIVETRIRPSPDAPPIPDFVTLLKNSKESGDLMTLGTFTNPPKGKDRNPTHWINTLLDFICFTCKKVAIIPHLNNPGKEPVSTEGIVCGHAYSILDIQDIPLRDSPDQIRTLIKLRNPWGNTVEWNGAFSDTDDKGWSTLTKDLRRKSDDRLKDGEFWISYESIVDYIEVLDVCKWGGKYRGNETTVFPEGKTCFIDFGKFWTENHGEGVDEKSFVKKRGYYAHLKPLNPTESGQVIDGLDYNCGLIVDLIYLNYTKSNDDPAIPEFGVWVLWGEDFVEPDEGFLNKVTEKGLYYEFRKQNRRVCFMRNLPTGTVYIIPWTKLRHDDEPPYYIRIIAEGKVFTYPTVPSKI